MTAESKSLRPHSRERDLPGNIEERIRRRAFELYEQRGKVNALALDDWLQAEAEILRAQKPKIKVARGSRC